MERAQKVEAVAKLNRTFEGKELVVVTHYKGLTVAEISDLRGKMREEGASFKVTKNRLAQRALEGTKFEGIVDLMKGPTALAISEDPVAAARVAYDFAKGNDKLVIIGGVMGDTVLDIEGVETLAKLPSLDGVRGQLVGLLTAPAQRIATVVQAPAAQLARVTQAYADKG